MDANTFYSLWTMRHRLPDKDSMVSLFPMDRPQASARSDALEYARQVDADSLLFIDSDMSFEPDLYERLQSIDADIACGLFWSKRIPSFPTVMRKAKMPDGSDSLANIIPTGKIVEIDACGMAATLIRRSVIQHERFAYPAFKHMGSIGEDYYFCLHARDAGFTIKCDTSLKVAHWGSAAFNGQPVLTHPDLQTLTNPFGHSKETTVERAV